MTLQSSLHHAIAHSVAELGHLRARTSASTMIAESYDSAIILPAGSTGLRRGIAAGRVAHVPSGRWPQRQGSRLPTVTGSAAVYVAVRACGSPLLRPRHRFSSVALAPRPPVLSFPEPRESRTRTRDEDDEKRGGFLIRLPQCATIPLHRSCPRRPCVGGARDWQLTVRALTPLPPLAPPAGGGRRKRGVGVAAARSVQSFAPPTQEPALSGAEGSVGAETIRRRACV